MSANDKCLVTAVAMAMVSGRTHLAYQWSTCTPDVDTYNRQRAGWAVSLASRMNEDVTSAVLKLMIASAKYSIRDN